MQSVGVLMLVDVVCSCKGGREGRRTFFLARGTGVVEYTQLAWVAGKKGWGRLEGVRWE